MIIATAGHVDHGKTSLVKALTGTNTDRLPEEKKRGLTIDIGFAYLKAQGGQNLAFIDVPGHEKFVRNMIAGVGMVDIAVIVVAADDGPMPQTFEHLAILQLMAVRNVVAVVSKVDLVTAERVAEVRDKVASLLSRAAFLNVRLFSLATSDQAAVASLKKYIVELAGVQPPRPKPGYFRMAIDRSFILDGSGTVVTGTVVGGEIRKGDTVTLLSDGADTAKSARVRSLHAQSAESEYAYTGQRSALNLSGELTRSMLRRGDWLVTNPESQSVKFIDVLITPALFGSDRRLTSGTPLNDSASTAPLKLHHWTSAHLHLGTADIPCRIALLNTTTLANGEYAFARLICEKAFSAVHGDRFVLRDQSARKTIAGGRVLDPYPPKRGRSKPERIKLLTALSVDTTPDILNALLDLSTVGVSLKSFALKLDLTNTEIESVAAKSNLAVVQLGSDLWGMKLSQSADLKVALAEALSQFHKAHPDTLGADAVSLKRLCAVRTELALLEHHLKLLVQDSIVVRAAAVYRLSDHEVVLSSDDEKHWVKVCENLSAAGLTPTRVGELAKVLDKTLEDTIHFLNHCVAHGKLYKVTDNRYFLPQTLREHAEIAVLLSASDGLTVAGFRDQSGVGRNLVVELLEYFDRCKFTQRIGDSRRTLSTAEAKF